MIWQVLLLDAAGSARLSGAGYRGMTALPLLLLNREIQKDFKPSSFRESALMRYLVQI